MTGSKTAVKALNAGSLAFDKKTLNFCSLHYLIHSGQILSKIQPLAHEIMNEITYRCTYNFSNFILVILPVTNVISEKSNIEVFLYAKHDYVSGSFTVTLAFFHELPEVAFDVIISSVSTYTGFRFSNLTLTKLLNFSICSRYESFSDCNICPVTGDNLTLC
jgi:hypothetical protein